MGVLKVKHLHIIPEIPNNLKGNVKDQLLNAYSKMMKDEKKHSITDFKLSDDILPSQQIRKKYGVIISESTNEKLQETFTINTKDGVPITFYNFSYDTSIEDEFEVMSTDEEEDEELSSNVSKIAQLQDGDYVDTSLWNKFMNMAKGFVNLMANVAKPVVSFIVKLVSFFYNTWKHIQPIVLNWILKVLGICEKFSVVIPIGASMDEIVSIAGQLEGSKKGFLSFVLDGLPQISSTIAKVLLWLGSVLSIVDTVIAVKKTMDAYEVHKKCAKDAQPISEYLKTTSEEARKISTTMLPLCKDKYSYNCAINQVRYTALARKDIFRHFASKHADHAKNVQKSRSEFSIWTIGRIAFELFGAGCGLVVGNFVSTLVQFCTSICRYLSNLAMYYFEESTVDIVEAANSAQTLLANQKFSEFILPSKDTLGKQTAGIMRKYAEELKGYHYQIQELSTISLYGFLSCSLTLFKTAMVSLYESIKGILMAMRDAAVWVMEKVAEGVDKTCEYVKNIAMKVWDWLKNLLGF